MPDSFVLVPECHVDTALAHALVLGRRKLVEHFKGKANVGKRLDALAAAHGARLCAIGLVDNDEDLFAQHGLRDYAPHALPAYSFQEHRF